MNTEEKQLDVGFMARWVIVTTVTTTVGVALGFGAFWALYGTLEQPVGQVLASVVSGAVLGALVGFGIGGGQAIVIAGRGLKPGRWLLYSVLGGALVAAAVFPLGNALSAPLQGLGELFMGIVLGLGVGAGQWIALRGRTANSGVWIAITTIAMVTGLTIAGALADGIGEGNTLLVALAAGLLVGGLTSLGAMWLFGRPRPAIVAQIGVLLALGLLLAGCGSSAEPLVRFAEPRDNATVASPVKVVMAAENFTVEPAAEGVHDDAGHLHIMVDSSCLEAGQAIPKDDAHLHFGDGSMEAELALAPGEHTLCLQAADGAHNALPGEGMTHTITVTVE